MAFKKIYSHWPESSQAALVLANTYLEMGSVKESYKILKSASLKNPDSYQVWNNLAVVEEKMGLKQSSQDSYKKALTLKSDSNSIHSM